MTPVDPRRLDALAAELSHCLDHSGADQREKTIALLYLAFEAGNALQPDERDAIMAAIQCRTALPAAPRFDA